MKNICKNCGKEYEFEPKHGTYKFKYCSQECKHAFAKKDEEPQYRICEYCGKEYWWSNSFKNYKEHVHIDTKRFCSAECSKNYKKEKIKQTCLKKYGVEYISQTADVKEKMKNAWKNKSEKELKLRQESRKQTNLKKYGVEYVSKLSEIKEKVKQTNLKKFGAEFYAQTDEYKEKYKQTNLKKYGVEHCSQVPKIAEKIKNSLLNKSKEEWVKIIDKRKHTNLEKYGTESASQNNDIKQKVKQTNLKKFGNEIAIQSDIIQSKIKQNNLEKYGVKYSIASDEVQEKIRTTNLKRYNYEYPFQSEELRKIMEENRKKTNLKKYGTENIIQVKEFKEKAKNTCLKKYGVPYNCMTENCLEVGHSTISKINLAFKNKLDKLNIQNKLEFHIDKWSYDFLCNDKFLIEINPSYTHNSSNTKKRLEFMKPKDKYYHFNKTKLAYENGYQCIHIWDWDDKEKILNILIDKKKIYARKLILKNVSNEECNKFLNSYHLQNTCKGQTIRLGLYKDNELIQLMTFGKARYTKNYEYELLRLCTKAEYKVIGGAEKLFKHFLIIYNPKSIISYCDNSKFSGEVYKRLNMNLKDYGTPRKHWYHIEKNKHITEALLLQRGYSQLHGDKEHIKGENNEKLMLEAGYVEIYDSGQSTYVWHKN